MHERSLHRCGPAVAPCSTASAAFRVFISMVRAGACLLALASLPSWAHFDDLNDGRPVDDPPPFVDESRLPFEPLPGLEGATQYWGVHEGAGFRIEVPPNWNRSLVMYAHGFRGNGLELTVSNPAIREYLLENGFAWAASSYYRNNYDVKAGVVSTNDLARHFRTVTGKKPRRHFIHGHSMGGHVTAAAIEQYPNRTCPEGRRGRFCRKAVNFLGLLAGGIDYSGAVPMCGVTGDERLFDYFLDFNVLAAELADVEVPQPAPEDYATTLLPMIQAGLFVSYPLVNNAQGDKLENAVVNLTGGPRPIVGSAYPFFLDLLFGFGGGDGSIDGITERRVASNPWRLYQLDFDPALSAEEIALNRDVDRFVQHPLANPRRFLQLEKIPVLEGEVHVPTVSLHTLGDLFVPFSMQQIYARRAAARRQEHLLVNRAIRAINHCEFSVQEQEQAFADMLKWVDEGVKPAGDDILDRETVGDPDFGCTFTSPVRSYDTGCAMKAAE